MSDGPFVSPFGDYFVDVTVRRSAWGDIIQLEVRTADHQPVHNWQDLYAIKTALFPNRYAIEVYPPQDRLVDGAHAYHLWVLPEGFRVPFGIHELDQETA